MGVTRESGAALPATLFALLAIGVLAASGFLYAFLESRAAENHEASVRAFYVADAGLNRALATATGDSAPRSVTSYDVEGGSARVMSRRILRLDGPWELRLFLSEGTHEPGREGAAHRTVAQLAHAPRPFRPPAALVAADTVHLEGDDRISGTDSSGEVCPNVADHVAGLAIRPGRFLGDTTSLDGNPALIEIAEIEAALLASGLDRRNVLRLEFVEPEWLIVENWPAGPLTGEDGWTATFAGLEPPPITGSVSGAGALVVAGDLEISGELRWEGLILVGGSAEVTGSLDVRGVVVVGLASGAGESAPRASGSVAGPGRIAVRYDGCAAAGAAARLSRGAIRRPGGWHEVY